MGGGDFWPMVGHTYIDYNVWCLLDTIPTPIIYGRMETIIYAA